MAERSEGRGYGTLLTYAGTPGSGTDEVQTLTVSGNPTGGTFTLSFNGAGFETGELTHDESAADIQTALRALATINGAHVDVAGSAGGPWTVTFVGNFASLVVPLLVLQSNSLTGGSSPTVGIVETTPGVNATHRGAPKGALCIDTTNGLLYQNEGTAIVPVWTEKAASSITYGTAGEMAAAGTSTANAAGSTAKSARIDHVHAIGAHDHSGATKGGAVAMGVAGSMAAAGTGTANAAGTGTAPAAIDHVHKLGDHDHSGATKGAQIGPTAFAADAFTADATGRAPFQDGIWTTAKVADGLFSADATGRAKMAAGFFGAADATSRALFADNFIDSTFAAAKITDNSIPGSKVNWSYGTTPGNISPDDSASAGTSAQVARIDHQHGITCAAPSAGLAAADAEGAATSFARSNHVHKACLADDVEFSFGDGDDAVIGWEVSGDADNHTLVIGLADANQALHIADKSAIATNWNVGADTHPSVYIHSDTTPATDYLKLYHDGTNGIITAAGGDIYIQVTPTNPAASGIIRVANNVFVNVARNAAAGGDVNMWKVNASDVIEAGTHVSLGANNLTTTGAVAIGTNPAAAGTLRLPNNTYITARNAANGADINMVKVNASDLVEFGVNVAATTFGGTVTLGTQQLSLSTGNVTFSGAGYIAMGANPASAGYIRLANNVDIAARNAGNDGDINMVKVNAADDVEVGADLQMGANTIYGDSAANGDLTLTATTNGTKTTSYIVPTEMVDVTTNSIAVRVKAGAVGDGETAQTDLNGEVAVDSTNGRWYFRYGAAWHYCAITAGFQIPVEEKVCPKCGKPIKIGQEVVGVIESVMEDGALHGLYQHSQCAA